MGVLKIPNFDAQGQVGRRVHELVREAQQKNVRALVLELRGNSGGLLNEMILTAAAFLDDAYVALVDRYNTERTEFRIRDGRLTITRNGQTETANLPFLARWRGPLVVLIDGNTASGGVPGLGHPAGQSRAAGWGGHPGHRQHHHPPLQSDQWWGFEHLLQPGLFRRRYTLSAPGHPRLCGREPSSSSPTPDATCPLKKPWKPWA